MKILLLILLMSCGGGHEHNSNPPPQQQPPNGGGNSGDNSGDNSGGSGGKPSYAQVQGTLNQKCLPCHATAKFMESEGKLRDSSALARVRARSMPPPNSNYKLSANERAQILAFF